MTQQDQIWSCHCTFTLCSNLQPTWLCTKYDTTSRTNELRQSHHVNSTSPTSTSPRQIADRFKTSSDRSVLIDQVLQGDPVKTDSDRRVLTGSSAATSHTQLLGEHHSGGRPDRQPCPTYDNHNTTLQPTMRLSVEPNLMDDVNRDWSLKITFASSPWGLRRPWM